MRFGLHISAGKGLKKAAETAIEATCETIQIFSGNPRGWRPSKLKPEEAAAFVSLTEEHDIRPIFLHTPYLVNLASPEPNTYERSIASVMDAFEKAAALGADCVLTHVGNHRGEGVEAGISRIAAAIARILAAAPEGVGLVLEGETGSGTEIGANFEEMAQVLASLAEHEARTGVCLDTAHMWAVGYDISTPQGVEEIFSRFDRTIGFERLRVIHANDTARDIGSLTDKHMVPGEGQIGLEGFRTMVNLPALADVPFILEKPGKTVEDKQRNLALMRGLIGQA